MDRDGIIGIIY